MVGAPGLDDNTGAAYVFAEAGGAWVQVAELGSSTPASEDDFGGSVWVEGDRILIGAPGADAAHVFELQGASWVETATLAPPPAPKDGEFGQAVVLADPYALVGAPEKNEVHVFERQGASWFPVQLIASGAEEFGYALDVQGDLAFVGAPKEKRVFVYERQPGGWIPSASLAPADSELDEEFGASLDFQGATLVIGAPGDDLTTGRAYVYELHPGGWLPVAELMGSGVGVGEEFGTSVAVSGDLVLVGAPGDDGGLGSAYLFERQGSSWIELEKMVPTLSSGEVNFANAVGLQGDTAMLNVGVDEVPFFGYAGSLYVWSAQGYGCQPLTATAQELSVSGGGAVKLYVQPGPDHAQKTYLLAGSASGTAPGLDLGVATVPLNADEYLGFTMGSPNAAPLAGSLGVLGPEGTAYAVFSLAPGSPASFVGLQLHHAFAVLDPLQPGGIAFVSNALPLLLTP